MPVYIIDKNTQSTGEHEVHQDDCTCQHMPDDSNGIVWDSIVTVTAPLLKLRDGTLVIK